MGVGWVRYHCASHPERIVLTNVGAGYILFGHRLEATTIKNMLGLLGPAFSFFYSKLE
eukprot:COSAG05_NODE_2453_length_3046_cov_5.297930_3_plen_58_part_00